MYICMLKYNLYGLYKKSCMCIFRANLLTLNNELLAAALYLNLKTLNKREIMADTEYLSKY